MGKERNALIKKKYDKLNNKTLPKAAKDKQAKISYKGKNKYWYGYKKHQSVDMQSGLINKVAVTPANVTDNKGFKHVFLNQGGAYSDKGYCLADSQRAAKIKNVHLVDIKRNNMKDKNKDLDLWVTKIQSPYERVFFKDNKRVQYVGVVKNQFAEFMKAICFNLRRVTVIKPSFLALS